MTEIATTRRPLRRNAGRLSLLVLGVLFVGWSLFWLVAWWRTGVELDARIKEAADRGYTIACAERSIGGYPLRIVITCRDPVVTIDADGGPVTLRFPRLDARNWLHAPTLIAVNLFGPLDVEHGGSGLRLHADWSSMTLGIRTREPTFDRVSVWGDDFTLTCPSCQGPADVLRIPAFQTHIRRAGGDRRDYNIAASFAGIRSAQLDFATGNDVPAVIALIGSISQFHAPVSLKLSDEAERWRLDGGRANLNTLSVEKGLMHAAIAGNFGLDPSHRIEGVYEISARNAASLVTLATRSLSPILQLAIGAALRQIDAATSRSDEMPVVKMTGTIEAGSVALGPFTGLVAIPPLY